MTRAILLGVVAFAFTGCGTVENFTRQEDAGTRPLEVYGGVSRSVEAVKSNNDAALRASDVAFSAIGDTLTLPITLSAAIARVIDAHHRPEQQQPASEVHPWNEGDQPSHLTPERIHGPIL